MSFQRINKLTVKNFKNLDNCVLEIQNIAAIVGANNSGKTNFLEVFKIMELLLFKGDEGKKKIQHSIDTFFFVKRNEPAFFEFDFDYSNSDVLYRCIYNIEIRTTDDGFKILKEDFSYKESNKSGPSRTLFTRAADSLKLRDENTSRTISDTQTAIEHIHFTFPEFKQIPSQDFRLILGVFEIASTTVFRVHSMSEYNSIVRSTYKNLFELQQKNDEKFNEFKEAFCEILNLKKFKITEYKVPDSSHVIYLMIVSISDDIKFCPLEETSDGTKILFMMLYGIFIEKNSIVVVDEPEIGLHPKAIMGFLKLFMNKSLSKQLILTTHSTFILNSIAPNLIYLIDKDDNGIRILRNVTEIKDLNKRLKSSYINFGDIFASNFNLSVDTSL